MTQKTFIRRIKKLHDFDVRSVMRTLDRPVGPEPQQRLKDLSKWFHSLTPNDQARVQQVVQLAVHHGIFDLLVLFDGAPLPGRPDKGMVELFYRLGRKRQLVAGPDLKLPPGHEMLSTMYHRQVYEQVFGSEV
jgi:hypothetical protein